MQALRNLIVTFRSKPNELVYVNVKQCVKRKLETLMPSTEIPYCDSINKLPELWDDSGKFLTDLTSPLLRKDSEEIPEVPRKMSFYENV